MDSNKINIAIIGRGVNQSKWNTIYEVLDENQDDVSYTKFEIASDTTWFKKVENGSFHAYIYLATMAKYTDLPHIKLPGSANEDEIMEGMELLVQLLFAEEDNAPIEEENINETPSSQASSELIELLTAPLMCVDLDESNDFLETNETHNGMASLVGVQFEINGKEVILNKEDSYKLAELITLVKELGYQVTDIITE